MTARTLRATGAWLLAGQLANGVGFALLARRTDPDAFGSFAAAYALTLLLSSLCDFGSSQRMTREWSVSWNRAEHTRWMRSRFYVSLPVSASAAALLLALGQIGTVTAVILSVQVVTHQLFLSISPIVRSRNAPWRAERAAAVGNSALIIGALVSRDSILVCFAVAAATSWLISLALAAAAVRAEIDWRWFLPGTLSNPWRGSVPYGLSGLANASQGAQIVLLERFGGAAAAGTAAAVARWPQLVAFPGAVVVSDRFPRFTQSRGRELRSELRTSASGVLVAAVAASIAIVGAPVAVEAVLGAGYSDAVPVLRLYCLAAVVVVAAQLLSALLQAQGMARLVAFVAVASAGSMLVSVMVLAARIGAMAMPLSLLLSSLVSLAVLFFGSRRVLK